MNYSFSNAASAPDLTSAPLPSIINRPRPKTRRRNKNAFDQPSPFFSPPQPPPLVPKPLAIPSRANTANGPNTSGRPNTAGRPSTANRPSTADDLRSPERRLTGDSTTLPPAYRQFPSPRILQPQQTQPPQQIQIQNQNQNFLSPTKIHIAQYSTIPPKSQATTVVSRLNPYVTKPTASQQKQGNRPLLPHVQLANTSWLEVDGPPAAPVIPNKSPKRVKFLSTTLKNKPLPPVPVTLIPKHPGASPLLDGEIGRFQRVEQKSTDSRRGPGGSQSGGRRNVSPGRNAGAGNLGRKESKIGSRKGRVAVTKSQIGYPNTSLQTPRKVIDDRSRGRDGNRPQGRGIVQTGYGGYLPRNVEATSNPGGGYGQKPRTPVKQNQRTVEAPKDARPPLPPKVPPKPKGVKESKSQDLRPPKSSGSIGTNPKKRNDVYSPLSQNAVGGQKGYGTIPGPRSADGNSEQFFQDAILDFDKLFDSDENEPRKMSVKRTLSQKHRIMRKDFNSRPPPSPIVTPHRTSPNRRSYKYSTIPPQYQIPKVSAQQDDISFQPDTFTMAGFMAEKYPDFGDERPKKEGMTREDVLYVVAFMLTCGKWAPKFKRLGDGER